MTNAGLGETRGAVIVPAHNEAAVIGRTLAPLGRLAEDGVYRLIVVCNGCTDDTADIVRGTLGAELVEIGQSSKAEALNEGDRLAGVWPRLYLDADVQISAAGVVAVLDALAAGDVLAARPECRFDYSRADLLVRSYYRARVRVFQDTAVLWGAGAYGLTESGHGRFGSFPPVMADDLYVDAMFQPEEKAIVATATAVVTTPTDARSLMAILRRWRDGDIELATSESGAHLSSRGTGLRTALALLKTIRSVQSALDACVYLGFAIGSRVVPHRDQKWARDESSRNQLR